MDMFSLNGKVALVTGAGSGIGQRLAIGLAEAGADVACFDLAGSAGLRDTAEQIRTLRQRALSLAGDVSNEEEIKAGIAKIELELGPLDVAVNCAGIVNAAAVEKMPLDQWKRIIEVNLTGVFLCCQAEARVMLERKRGSIINIASISGLIVNRGLLQAHYNTSKAGVIHLTKSLAMEWSNRGLRVNAISPGYTLTPMNLRPEAAEQRKVFEADTPMGRMATVDEMVGPAVFLASQASSFCTGLNLVVDGGFVCW
jgi:NAD(P)-dependent dehydrogenase (short-subunit alcohol dehydrogenase family)